MKAIKLFLYNYNELIFWVLALLFLLINPFNSNISFCLFDFLGMENCLGCGIGASIHYLLQGDLIKSWYTHPIGVFALVVILFRIYKILINKY